MSKQRLTPNGHLREKVGLFQTRRVYRLQMTPFILPVRQFFMQTLMGQQRWLIPNNGGLLLRYTRHFLYCAARIIRDNGGEVVAYDGDRVMGVFLGDQQAQNAAIVTVHIPPPFRRRAARGSWAA